MKRARKVKRLSNKQFKTPSSKYSSTATAWPTPESAKTCYANRAHRYSLYTLEFGFKIQHSTPRIVINL